MTDPTQVTETHFPRHTAIALGVFATLMIGLLCLQLVLLRSQDRTTKRQLAGQLELVRPAVPALTDARPLIAAIKRSDPEATARQARALAAQLLPLVRAMRDANAPQAIAETADLARALRDANAPQAIAESAILARRLLQTDAVGRGATAAERAARAAGRIDEVIALQREALRLQRASFSIQRRTFAIQQQTIAILTESLGIQRATLGHAESIDRKTVAPPPSPATPTPPPLP